ncbi:hypothetical protein RVBP21_0300 [Pseudomonas phage BRkr]|nr:hypothetical protein RVBP21_0300 [Pseudomonas phage BRkr]
MNPLLHALPYDGTGTCFNNRTRGEYHNLADQAGLPYRVIVLDKGYFYNNNLHMIDGRGYVLKEKDDFQCTQMHPEITKKTGIPAFAVIVIKNPRVHHEIRVDAQMVGGVYCNLGKAIANQALGLINNTRKIHWNNITGKPDDYKPNGHLHALWELYGFTLQVLLLKRITAAGEKFVKKDMDALFDQYKAELALVGDELTSIEQRLTTHINDRNNPHKLTAAKVQLDKVKNAAIATKDQAEAANGDILDRYATPLRAKQSIDKNFLPILQAHVDDRNNPHKETAAKLGTYTVQEHQQVAGNYYNRGETVNSTERIGGVKDANNNTTSNGMTFQELYEFTRQDEILGQLKTGLLPPQTFASGAIPPANNYAFLVPASADAASWLHWIDIQTAWIDKPKSVIYAAGSFDPNGANAEAQLNNVLGRNHPAGTTAIFRYLGGWGIGTGNGAITTYINSVGFAVFNTSLNSWKV